MWGPRAVRSIEEEDRIIGRCACGAESKLAANRVRPVRGRWYDVLLCRCSQCEARRQFTFDITHFFVPRPGVFQYQEAA